MVLGILCQQSLLILIDKFETKHQINIQINIHPLGHSKPEDHHALGHQLPRRLTHRGL